MAQPVNGQRIRDLYAAFAAGDGAAMLGAFHPPDRLDGGREIPYADRNPYIGLHAVAEGIFGRIMTEWDGFTVTPEKIVDGGETVAAMGRHRGV